MLHLKVNGHAIRNHMDEGIVYLPDFIVYDMDETDYRQFWQAIHQHPRAQLYTDGVQVYQVSWLQSIFQRFKGWLGFENHCHPKKVEMTLAKIAYFGYLRGYKSDEFTQLNPPVLSGQFKDLALKTRSDQTTEVLQSRLLGYFHTYSTQIVPYLRNRIVNHRFGDAFLNNALEYLIPSLDPQNTVLINSTTTALEGSFLEPDQHNYFKGSRFAEAYAYFLANNRQYGQAVKWSESVVPDFKRGFIDYYYNKGDQNSLAKCIDLIEELSNSLSPEEREDSISILRDNFSYEEQLYYLENKPKLKEKLAASYLEDAKSEKARSRLSKFLTGTNLLQLLGHAVNLYPGILDEDTLMNDPTMKAEWVIYQFNEAIKHENFDRAVELYEQHPDFKFNRQDLDVLQDYYRSELEAVEKNIKTHLSKSTIQQGTELAEKALHIAKQIAQLSPGDNPLPSTINTYVKTLLEVEKIEHPEVKDANLPQLAKLLGFIRDNTLFEESDALKNTANEVRLRAIDCLVEKVKVSSIFTNSSATSREETLKEIEKPLKLLLVNLTAFEKRNKDTKSKDTKLALGRVYYLHADIHEFFYRDKDAALPLFQKAHETVPANLYYKLKYLELTESEERHEVRERIANIGFLQEQYYQNWLEERWADEIIMSEGFNIHAEPKDEGGLRNFFRRLF